MSGEISSAIRVEQSTVRLKPLLVTGLGTAAAAGVGGYAVATGGPTMVALMAAAVLVVGLVLTAVQLTQVRRRNTGRVIPEPPHPEPAADESVTALIPIGALRADPPDTAADAPAPEPAGVAAPEQVSPQIEPSTFHGGSTAGRAQWHLPKGFAPAGLSADGLRLGDVDARAASVVGPGHRCQEPAIPRQDAYLLRRTDDGDHLIIAVADGVSQSRLADLGARLAVSAAARGVATVLDGGRGVRDIDPVTLFTAVAGEMVGTARSQSHAVPDIYAILVVAVIPTHPEPDGRRTMWTAQIGDVSVWILRSGSLTRQTGPDKAGMDKNALEFVLPADPGAARASLIELQPGDTVAVMTDGLSESLVNITGVADFFSRQWASGPPHPVAFLHQLCYDAPGQSDDRTVVTTWVGAADQDTGRPTTDPAGRPHHLADPRLTEPEGARTCRTR